MVKKDRLKIVLDCNWYISASINRKSRRVIFSLVNNPKILVIYSDELLAEFNEVISRAKFQQIISRSQANRFIHFLKPRLQNVTTVRSIDVSRDKKDNYLLALSEASQADYLVTGDEGLLALKSFEKTRIITMREFLEII